MKNIFLVLLILLFVSCCPEETEDYNETLTGVKFNVFSDAGFTDEEINVNDLELEVSFSSSIVTAQKTNSLNPVSLLMLPVIISCGDDTYTLEKKITYVEVSCSENILGVNSGNALPYNKYTINYVGSNIDMTVLEWLEQANKNRYSFSPVEDTNVIIKFQDSFSSESDLKFTIKVFLDDNTVLTSETDNFKVIQ